jgi:hypothetical protein
LLTFETAPFFCVHPVYCHKLAPAIFLLSVNMSRFGIKVMHRKELNYFTPQHILFGLLRRKRLAEHMACMRVSVEKCEGKDRLKDLDVDGRIILKWITQDGSV